MRMLVVDCFGVIETHEDGSQETLAASRNIFAFPILAASW
jgi:hypothetical protein